MSPFDEERIYSVKISLNVLNIGRIYCKAPKVRKKSKKKMECAVVERLISV
jgi:hypothetical protein